MDERRRLATSARVVRAALRAKGPNPVTTALDRREQQKRVSRGLRRKIRSTMTRELQKPTSLDKGTADLLGSLRALIEGARQSALRAVDAVQVQTCWKSVGISSTLSRVGFHVPSMEHDCSKPWHLLSQRTSEKGSMFRISDICESFTWLFPIRDALRRELSWTHYRTLLRVEGDPLGHGTCAKRQAKVGRQALWNGKSAPFIMSDFSPALIAPLLKQKRPARLLLCRRPVSSCAIL